MTTPAENKNDNLDQGSAYNHILTGYGKSHLVLGLIEKEYNKHFD